MGVMAEATKVDKINEHISGEKKDNNKLLDDGKSKENLTSILKKISYQTLKESKAMLLCSWSGCLT